MCHRRPSSLEDTVKWDLKIYRQSFVVFRLASYQYFYTLYFQKPGWRLPREAGRRVYLSVSHDFSIEENSLAIDFLQPGTVYHNIFIILSFGPCEFWNRSREQESARFSLKGIDFFSTLLW
jgi:hypothetical protein